MWYFKLLKIIPSVTYNQNPMPLFLFVCSQKLIIEQENLIYQLELNFGKLLSDF